MWRNRQESVLHQVYCRRYHDGQHCKNVDMIMDSFLNSEAQILSTISKMKSILRRLKRMSSFIHLKLRTKQVLRLIFLVVDYSSVVCDKLSGVLDSKLQVFPGSYVSFVCGFGWWDHVTPPRLKLHWLTTRNTCRL